MKKFIFLVSAFLISQSAAAQWSEEDRSSFSKLLWLSEVENDVDTKVRMVRFISCITAYYELNYSFSGVLEKWNSTPVDQDFLSEFIYVNETCDRMIQQNVDVSNT